MKKMGQCYRTSYQYILKEVDEDEADFRNYRLVHGSILAKLPEDGGRRRRADHAWVEFEDDFGVEYVLDIETHGFPGEKVIYYNHHKAKVHKSFTRKQAIETGIKKGFWGEW